MTPDTYKYKDQERSILIFSIYILEYHPNPNNQRVFFMCRYIYIYFFLEWVSPQKDLYFLGFIHLFCSYIHVCFQLDAFIREHVWHKALLMGYSMRLELTHACSLNGNQLVMGFFLKVAPFFFLETHSKKKKGAIFIKKTITKDLCSSLEHFDILSFWIAS